MNGTFHLSPHENILTIALINIHYLYIIAPGLVNAVCHCVRLPVRFDVWLGPMMFIIVGHWYDLFSPRYRTGVTVHPPVRFDPRFLPGMCYSVLSVFSNLVNGICTE